MVKKILSQRLPLRGTWVPLSKSESHHAIRVLRMRDGDRVQALDGEGGAAWAILRTRGGDGFLEYTEVEGEFIVESGSPKTIPISIEMGILKSEAMEWVVEKAVELGVANFHPVICAHSVTQIKTKGPEFFQQRWQKIADQALKQCGRPNRMMVHPPQNFESLFTTVDHPVRFWCDEKKKGQRSELIPHLQSELPELKKGIYLLIGPEGGWSNSERELLTREEEQQKLLFGVSLGNRILRAETAALFTMSVVSAWAAQR